MPAPLPTASDADDVDAWLASAQGRYVLDWEQAALDGAVADIFGYHALQLGQPRLAGLRGSRIPLRQRIGDPGTPRADCDVVCEFAALPFAAHSIDLAILPHTLEFAADPHQILREIERVMIPEGRLLILGFNPYSLWGAYRYLRRRRTYPWQGSYLSAGRLTDWLKLLGFDVDRGSFGCYAPPCTQEGWLRRWHFAEGLGARWWRFSGSVYLLQAVKRAPGMHLITPPWRRSKLRAKALRPVAQRQLHKENSQE
jgi:SAM-dependent methyltransferase